MKNTLEIPEQAARRSGNGSPIEGGFRNGARFVPAHESYID
tara:strand:- start:25671 stop:25793 length:123 start_codon:yes stop_codon:yes gene_type:complete